MSIPLTQKKTFPFRGGVVKDQEKGLIPTGGFSDINNLRQDHSGFKPRKGATEQHTSDGGDTQEVISLYQFSKGKQVERHLFRQMADGSVEESTNNPPTQTTGVFGSEVLAARTSPSPASYSKIQDLMLYSDGAGQHVIYPGDTNPVDSFIVYKGGSAIPDIPEEGNDYTTEVRDSNTSTVAVLDSLSTLAAFDAVFIGCPVQADAISITVENANGNASVMTMHYRKNDSTWATTAITDGTASGGASIAVDGDITWTPQTDEVPHYMFGLTAFWYRLTFSAALDASVTVSQATYSGNFQEMQELWDGFTLNPAKVQKYVNADTAYTDYDSTYINIGGLAVADYIYFSTPYRIFGFHVEIVTNPNTTGSVTIDEVDGYTGSGFTGLTGENDGSSGCSKSGFVTFARNDSVTKSNWNSSLINAYWYRFSLSGVVTADCRIKLTVLPYFNIDDIWATGQCNDVWKERGIFSFNDNYVWISAKNRPNVLHGLDTTPFPVGDGRSNKVLAMRKFYNELLIWQEEKGKEGGCLSILEGDRVTGAGAFDKLVLDTKIGIVNSKSAVVVRDVNISDINPDRPIGHIAVWLSRYGVYFTDGINVVNASKGISNYFDPAKSECIRAGYEDKHFLEYDEADNVIRVGLVSGSSATKPNVFLIMDAIDRTWSTDTYGQDLSCMANIEASSGDIPILQVAGTQDGRVLQINNGANDISTAIDYFATMELNGQGNLIKLKHEYIRAKNQTGADITRAFAFDGSTSFDTTTTNRDYSIADADSNKTYVRITEPVEVQGEQISVKWRNNTISEDLFLLDVGFQLEEIENNQ
jgi:hypothetical protein